jgi:aminopeptidase N
VNDVSIAVSDSHIWDAASVEVEKGRRVLVNSVMPDSSNHYKESAQFGRYTIEHFSKEFPGYPYPYPHATSFFNGRRGGGMETPMMANNGSPQGRASYIGLVAHEFAHSYFPFFMGTNERKYAFMDEGWATFMPIGVIEEFEPDYPYVPKRVTTYEISAGYEGELPPIVPSFSIETNFTRTNFYNRPAVAYICLQRLLGKNLFKQAVIEFIDRWQEKHPIPLDFFNTVSDVAGKDLSWFFEPWFYEFGYPDLNLESVNQEAGEVSINVKKLGNIPTKVLVNIYFEDDKAVTIERPASVWKDGNTELKLTKKVDSEIVKVELGSVKIPDSNRKNNVIELE